MLAEGITLPEQVDLTGRRSCDPPYPISAPHPEARSGLRTCGLHRWYPSRAAPTVSEVLEQPCRSPSVSEETWTRPTQPATATRCAAWPRRRSPAKRPRNASEPTTRPPSTATRADQAEAADQAQTLAEAQQLAAEVFGAEGAELAAALTWTAVGSGQATATINEHVLVYHRTPVLWTRARAAHSPLGGSWWPTSDGTRPTPAPKARAQPGPAAAL